jgi:hypothetical protein
VSTAAIAAISFGLVIAPSASAAGATAVFTKTQDWGSGFGGSVAVTNGTASPLAWNVQFDLPAGYSIPSAWDSVMVRSGQHYTFTAPSWAGALAAGASTSFGFNGNPGNFPGILNCTLNGNPCSGGSGPGTPGTPGAPSVTGATNSSLALSWGASTGTVTGYRVYEGTDVRATVTGTTASIGNLGTCTSHTYTVRAYNSAGESTASTSVSGTTTGCANPGGRMAGAPYLYLGWGNPPDPVAIMNATGVKAFTMAFMLSSGGCNPAWDGQRPLTGGADATAISRIKGAGGQVQISFGGWSGNKLGPNCSTPEAFAGAVQQVITAHRPDVVDFDIENSDEFENETVQDRILNGLKIVKQNNPSVKVVVTFGTTTGGPTYYGTRLIKRSQELGVPIDNYTIMPFDFAGGTDMYQSTVNATEGLKDTLKTTFGWTDAQAYAHAGISGMNGLSDQRELTTPQTWTRIRDWALQKGIGRFAYWSVNRDRPCPNGGVTSDCSGIDQAEWEFTRITAGF